jgi:hypothetical protein
MMLAAPATVASAVHDALHAITRWIGHFSVLDWILVGVALAIAGVAWIRALAFARLGNIEIQDLVTDDPALGPAAVKAELQRQLARRGWVPASGVPNGSPVVASVAAAITAAPLPQAKWLGTLMGLLPVPPTSTGFKLTGTLLSKEDEQQRKLVGLSYELVCLGPKRDTEFGEESDADWQTVVERASKTIYMKIGESAPAIYPRWSRWASVEALTAYREGLDRERQRQASELTLQPRSVIGRYEDAYERYREASTLDPDNMLARLRAANCLERIAGNLDGAERARKQTEAVLAYIAIRLRQPGIFEAGFRASVLLSGLAEATPHLDGYGESLALALGQLNRASGRNAERHAVPAPTDEAFKAELERAARRESRLARRRLRPLWTIVHEGRFRHRFEPKGQERRQLRKALGISHMALRARNASREAALRQGSASDVAQLCWRGWVSGRYMLGRSRIAGWQAHYDAACFYALLPQASDRASPMFGASARRRALWHLGEAIDQADGAMPSVYARDEDPDLNALRKLSPQEFQRVAQALCPDELTIRYQRPNTEGEWGLRAWGAAVTETTWAEPVRPVSCTDSEAVYCLHIVDETKPLCFLAHHGGEKDEPGWRLTPVNVESSQVWVRPGDATISSVPPAG